MNLSFRLAALSVLAFVGSVLTAGAEEIRIKYGSPEANSLLYGEGESGANPNWAQLYTDGRNPHAGADYALYGGTVDNVKYLSSGRSKIGESGHTVFKGDSLRLGDLASNQGFDLLQRQGGSSYAACSGTINNFILEKGAYHLGSAGASHCELKGTMDVRSPETSPFDLYVDDTATLSHWRFSTSISGAAGTALRFCYAEKGRADYAAEFVLAGDNSAYKGKFIVDGVSAWLCLADGKAMGENAPLADAIILRNGGGVGGAEGTSATVTSSRGITVEATGGTFYAGAGAFFRLSAPVTGTGAVRVTGGGTFYFNGDYQAGDITVGSGTSFLLGADADLHGATVTYEGGENEEIWLPEEGTTESLDLSEMTDPTIVFSHTDILKSGTFALTGVCATWPLRLKIADGFERPAATKKFTILRIPTALKTVSADDFYFTNRRPQSQRHWIEIDGDDQIVCLEFPKVLTARGDGFQWGGGSKPDYWTDGTVDYQYGQNTSRSCDLYDPNVAYLNTLAKQQRVALPTPFCGEGYLYSLSLAPSSRSNVNYGWKVSNERVFSDLRLYGNTYLYPNAGNMIIAGGIITVAADADAPAEVMGFADATHNYSAELKSDLAGDGVLRVGAEDKVTASGSRIVLAGDNGRFRGTIVHDTRCTNETFTSILEIADNDALGGNLAKPTADAVQLSGTGNTLRATDDVTLAAPNRGITVGDGYAIDVVSGKTLTISSPLILSGTVTKTGAGKLVLSPNVSTEGTAELVVREGRIALDFDVPPTLDVVFEGGALTFPANGVTNTYPASLLSPSAKLGVEIAADGVASGCYEMTTAAKADFWPVGIMLNIAMRPAKELKFPILRIPTSVRTVTKDDFYVSSLTPYEEELTVETAGDMQTVYLSFPEVMTAMRLQNSAPLTVWKHADGTTVTNAEDAAYAYFTDRNGADSSQFRISKLSDPFAGKSFSVIGASASSYSHFYFRNNVFDRTVDDFRFYPFVRLGHLSGSSDLTFRGKMSVYGTETSPVIFEASQNSGGALDIRSSLAGDGYLKIALSTGRARSATFGLKGDNSRFVGTLDFSRARVDEENDSGVFVDPTDGSLTNYLDVALGDGTSLGGELPTFNAKAVRVRGANGLTVTEDVLVCCTNRGFYFADVPRVSVADGKTFAIGARSTFAGTLTKSGAGALKLAGVAAETPTAGANAVTVEAGALELTKPWAVSNVAFDVADADSATLRLSRTAVGTQGLVNTVDDAPFGTSGAITLAWADGEGLALEPRTMRKAQIPLMTVKASATAALVQRIVVPTGSGSYQLRTVTDGDVATIFVDAELKPGLVFVVK